MSRVYLVCLGPISAIKSRPMAVGVSALKACVWVNVARSVQERRPLLSLAWLSATDHSPTKRLRLRYQLLRG